MLNLADTTLTWWFQIRGCWDFFEFPLAFVFSSVFGMSLDCLQNAVSLHFTNTPRTSNKAFWKRTNTAGVQIMVSGYATKISDFSYYFSYLSFRVSSGTGVSGRLVTECILIIMGLSSCFWLSLNRGPSRDSVTNKSSTPGTGFSRRLVTDCSPVKKL